MSTPVPVSNETVAQLCPACGLCCNGVLFGDVELRRGDDAKLLTSVGLELFRKGSRQAFTQPCACFDGKLCRIYADRPKRCATFECGLLKRVQDGEMKPALALRKIAETRRQADRVLQLLRSLGDVNETLPLNKRYAAVSAQPIDLSADKAEVERRGELMLAVAKLMELLERDFLK